MQRGVQARTEGRTYFLPPVYFWHRIQNIPVCMWWVAFVLSARFLRPKWQAWAYHPTALISWAAAHALWCLIQVWALNWVSLPPEGYMILEEPCIFQRSDHHFRGLGSESKGTRSCLTLWTPWTVAHQAPPCMGLTPFQLPKFLPCLLSLRLGMLIDLSVTTLHLTKLSYLMLVIIL